jgi:hypothetical protein
VGSHPRNVNKVEKSSNFAKHGDEMSLEQEGTNEVLP